MTTATITSKCIVRVVHDTDPMNPREGNDLTKMVFWNHRRYTCDKNPYGSIEAFHENVTDKTAITLPVYMYDHSGVTISTSPFSCRWDSGQAGSIYALKADIRKAFGWKLITKARREKIITMLNNEVKVYDDYLTGNVHGIEIVDPETDEVIESCYGYFGDNWKENGAEEYVNQFKDELKDNAAIAKWVHKD